MDPSMEVAASEEERKPAGEEIEAQFRTSSELSTQSEECCDLETMFSMRKVKLKRLKSAFLPSTPYRRSTLYMKECHGLETVIFRLKNHLMFCKELAASEKEIKPAGKESEEPSNQLPSTSSGMSTLSEEECRDLETKISRLKNYLRFSEKVAASEKQRKPAGEESEEWYRTFYGKSTLTEKHCRDLYIEISRLEGNLKRRLTVPDSLLTTLEELSEEQLKTFQSSLSMVQMPGFSPIPESQLESVDEQVTVNQMVKRYGPERAVEITLRILRRMKDDLAERDHTGAWMLNTLDELNIKKLKTFQNYLTSGQLFGFPPIPESQMENTDRPDIVDQMVERYGPEVAGKITLRILRRMNWHNLTKMLQRDHTEPSGPEEDVQRSPATLRKMTWDPLEKLESECFPEDFEPVIYDQEGNDAYRFPCPSAGLFQCNITGLVFRMEGEGDVLYRTVSWDRRLLSQSRKRPAGPLFKFTCLKGSVSQLYLPHCEICPGDGCDFLSVAHVTDDDNIEFLPAHEITETHIIINITGFSAYGDVKDDDAPITAIRSLVLLFYQPSDDTELESVLNVLLLPGNVVVREVQEERARRNARREIYIDATSNCKLTADQSYRLSTDPVGQHQVKPEKGTFYEDYNNYITMFKVFLHVKVKIVKLMLNEDKNEESVVWRGDAMIQGTPSEITRAAPLLAVPPVDPPILHDQAFITKHRSELEARMGELQPILLRLQDCKVLNGVEREKVDHIEQRVQRNKALIDMVLRKGHRAQEHFYKALEQEDPYLVKDLERQTD